MSGGSETTGSSETSTPGGGSASENGSADDGVGSADGAGSEGRAASAALTATFDYEAVTRDDSAARVSSAVAVGAAVIAVATSAFTLPALGVGGLGGVVLVVGLLTGSRRALGLGLVGLLGGVGLAGLTGAPPAVLLVASAASAVSWDVGENAISIGEQLGRAADTTRAELVHAAGTVGVTGFAAIIGVVAYRVSGPRPSLALVALLLGAVLLIFVLDS